MGGSRSKRTVDIDGVIADMKEYIDDILLVIHGCEEIINALNCDFEKNEVKKKMQTKLMNKGAGEAIINGMLKHANFEDVQMNGCKALWSLASNNKKNFIALMKIGAGKAMINAMNNHQNNKDIQQYGCWILKNLAANNNEKKVRLMKIGAGEVIINAMNNHKYNIDVQYYGCWVLLNLAFNNNDNQVTLMKIGAGEAIINAMNNHKDNQDVQKHGCWALMILADNNDNKVILMKIGAGEAIMNAMNNHKDNQGVQHWGCGALANIIQIKLNLPLFSNIELLKLTVENSIKTYPDSPLWAHNKYVEIKELGKSVLEAIKEYEEAKDNNLMELLDDSERNKQNKSIEISNDIDKMVNGANKGKSSDFSRESIVMTGSDDDDNGYIEEDTYSIRSNRMESGNNSATPSIYTSTEHNCDDVEKMQALDENEVWEETMCLSQSASKRTKTDSTDDA